MPTPHKQVSVSQLEIWLADPVTKAYLESLQYCLTKAKETLAQGVFVDPQNTSTTQYNGGYLNGRRDTLTEFVDPALILARYEQSEEQSA